MAESTALLKRRLGIPRTQGSNPCLSASAVEKSPVFSTVFSFTESAEVGVLTPSDGALRGTKKRVFATRLGKQDGKTDGSVSAASVPVARAVWISGGPCVFVGSGGSFSTAACRSYKPACVYRSSVRPTVECLASR